MQRWPSIQRNRAMVDLTTHLGPLILQNPITTASGTFGYGIEYAPFLDLDQLGAITLKGTTLLPRKGNAPVRIAETPSGMLNAVGLQNDGVEQLLNFHLPQLERFTKVKVIVNVSGNTLEDYIEVTRLAAAHPRVNAIELNISCPNVKQGGMAFGTDTIMAATITQAVRAQTAKPLIVKLSPNVTDIASIAKAVVHAGADIISLINTVLGLAIDIQSKKPILSTATGGLSGPAIKPIALRAVWQVRKAVTVPIIGMGGIFCLNDVLEFLIAGATAVSIGTANFYDPRISAQLVTQLENWLKTQPYSTLKSLSIS